MQLDFLWAHVKIESDFNAHVSAHGHFFLQLSVLHGGSPGHINP